MTSKLQVFAKLGTIKRQLLSMRSVEFFLTTMNSLQRRIPHKDFVEEEAKLHEQFMQGYLDATLDHGVDQRWATVGFEQLTILEAGAHNCVMQACGVIFPFSWDSLKLVLVALRNFGEGLFCKPEATPGSS